ncbi:Acrosin-binding protein [Bienertia sinuspersici]
MAVRHEVRVAVEARLRNLIIESDCLKVIQAVKQKKKESTAFGSIICDILHLVKSCSFVEFCHVKREANQVAHNLARVSSSYDEMYVWMEEAPSSIMHYVMADFMHEYKHKLPVKKKN